MAETPSKNDKIDASEDNSALAETLEDTCKFLQIIAGMAGIAGIAEDIAKLSQEEVRALLSTLRARRGHPPPAVQPLALPAAGGKGSHHPPAVQPSALPVAVAEGKGHLGARATPSAPSAKGHGRVAHRYPPAEDEANASSRRLSVARLRHQWELRAHSTRPQNTGREGAGRSRSPTTSVRR